MNFTICGKKGDSHNYTVKCEVIHTHTHTLGSFIYITLSKKHAADHL